MVHNCYLCNVNFSSKRNLDNHLQKTSMFKKNEKTNVIYVIKHYQVNRD